MTDDRQTFEIGDNEKADEPMELVFKRVKVKGTVAEGGTMKLITVTNYRLPDKVFGLRYQPPPFDNVLIVRLTQGGSF